MQVQPEEQRVAAEQGSQEGTGGIPAIQLPRDVAERARFPAQMVKDQRQRGAGEQNGNPDPGASSIGDAADCTPIPRQKLAERGAVRVAARL